MTITTGRRTTPAAAPLRSDWRNQAACRDSDPELFFPIGTTGPAAVQTEEAKRVCAGCPVVGECLSWAVETGQCSGVWGGLSEQDRWELRRKRDPERPVARRVSPMLDRCLGHQSLIEERLARRVSRRQIARELGVGLDSVRRAIRVFDAERSARGETLRGVAS